MPITAQKNGKSCPSWATICVKAKEKDFVRVISHTREIWGAHLQ